MYQYDKINAECSIVKEDLIIPYSVWNGWVYYADSEGIYRHSIDGGTIEVIGDHQPIEVSNITLTEDYIILCDHMGDGGLILYDYEGTQIAMVSVDMKPTWYFGGDSERLFAECACDNKTRLCFMDLTRPLDELQWEELKAE